MFVSCIPPINVHALPIAPIAYTIGLKLLKGYALRKMIDLGHEKFKDTSMAQEISKAFKLDPNGIVTPISWASDRLPFGKVLRKFAMSDEGDIVGRAIESGKPFVMHRINKEDRVGVMDTGIQLRVGETNEPSPFYMTDSGYDTQYQFLGMGLHRLYSQAYSPEPFALRQTDIDERFTFSKSNIIATNMSYKGSAPPSNPFPTIQNFVEQNTVTVNNTSILNITNNNYYINKNDDVKPGVPPGQPIDSTDKEDGETEGFSLWNFVKGIFGFLGDIVSFIANLGTKIVSFLWRLIVPENLDLIDFPNIDNFSFSFFINLAKDFGEFVDKNVDEYAPVFQGTLPNPFGDDWTFIVDFQGMFPPAWDEALTVIRTFNSCVVLFATILFIKNKFETFFE